MDIQTLEDERRRAIQAQGDLRMGVSGGWNVAGKNMISSPYAPFEPFDDGYDDPEDYRGQPVFGVEEDGQMFFDFPFVQAPSDMMISWVKNVGDELTPQEVMDGLRIIDQTETNPLKKRLRLDRMMDNNPPKA